MNNKENHIRQLLKRWISGDIKSQGEQRLDKAAQGDKFLGEALAGLRSTTENDHEQNLSRLRTQLKLKEEKSKIVYFTPLRIAASVALLLTAGWFIWTGPSLNEDQNIAMSKEMTPSRDAAPPVSSTEIQVETTEAPQDAAISRNESSPTPTQKRQPGLVEEEEIQMAPPPPPPAPIIADDNDMFSNSGAGSGIANSSTPTSASFSVEKDSAPIDTEKLVDINDEALAAKKAREEDYARVLEQKEDVLFTPVQINPMAASNVGPPVAISGYRMIEGYVTDSEGYPLIGATVLEEGTENGAICDINGYFTLAVKEGRNTQLVCSYTGFELTNVRLNEETNYAIVLSEGENILSEVMVTALGTSRDKKSVGYSISQIKQDTNLEIFIIQPLGGFNAFKDYIRQNTPRGTRRGKVRLRFIVSANGRPSDISVIHSSNTQLNNLAIGLISSGPNWVISTSDESVEVEYLMRIR